MTVKELVTTLKIFGENLEVQVFDNNIAKIETVDIVRNTDIDQDAVLIFTDTAYDKTADLLIRFNEQWISQKSVIKNYNCPDCENRNKACKYCPRVTGEV